MIGSSTNARGVPLCDGFVQRANFLDFSSGWPQSMHRPCLRGSMDPLKKKGYGSYIMQEPFAVINVHACRSPFCGTPLSLVLLLSFSLRRLDGRSRRVRHEPIVLLSPGRSGAVCAAPSHIQSHHHGSLHSAECDCSHHASLVSGRIVRAVIPYRSSRHALPLWQLLPLLRVVSKQRPARQEPDLVRYLE